MEINTGFEKLKNRINECLGQKLKTLDREFDKFQSTGFDFCDSTALLPFDSVEDFAKNNKYDPWGFYCGINAVKAFGGNNGTYNYKKVYPFIFDEKNNLICATAIDEEKEYSEALVNFALRSIVSYPIGRSIVYMLDAKISGSFNQINSISTDLKDYTSEKNFFHYITVESEKQDLISELEQLLNKNIRSFCSNYSSLYEYNQFNPSNRVPYNFVFIRDIVKCLGEEKLKSIVRMVSYGEATKAGIFFFFTYRQSDLTPSGSHNNSNPLQELVEMSSTIDGNVSTILPSQFIYEKIDRSTINRVLDYVGTQKIPKSVSTFKSEIENMLSSNRLWEQSYRGPKENAIYIPVGYQSATEKQEIEFNFSNASPHAYIGGQTGSGKSVLLHNIIINGALRYSPDQLQFYLVDMKGVCFNMYKDLPHVIGLSASSSRHYALSLLEQMSNEMDKREILFSKAGTSNITEYNKYAKANGMPILPFVFGIMDEFQVLLSVQDSLKKEANAYIAKLHKGSRAYGIMLTLCTQSAANDGLEDRTQIGIKISLISGAQDSRVLLGNEAAAQLRGVGKALMNLNKTGEARYNHEFQVTFIDENNELPGYIKKIKEIYLNKIGGKDDLIHLSYDKNDKSAKIKSNLNFNNPDNSNFETEFFVGQPEFFRVKHVSFKMRRESKSNILMIGNDRTAAIRLNGIIALQFMRNYKNLGYKVLISDLQRKSESTYENLKFLVDTDNNVSLSNSLDAKEMLDNVYNILKERKANPNTSDRLPEILYSIIDIHEGELFDPTARSTSSMFSLSGPSESNVSAIQKLKEIIKTGPQYGVHTLLYVFNSINIATLLTDEVKPYMEVKIALRGGEPYDYIMRYCNKPIINEGSGYILMPPEMGLKYTASDSAGDPFRIYSETGFDKNGSVWDKLFNSVNY